MNNNKSELKGHTWRLKGALTRVVWAEDCENLGTPGHGEGRNQPAGASTASVASLLVLVDLIKQLNTTVSSGHSTWKRHLDFRDV